MFKELFFVKEKILSLFNQTRTSTMVEVLYSLI
ncbi:Uncharacterised protein [Myroides odoratus]|uniref:Uncharacterized protein n=1 Tax=Myroides odoratus TaxID=256 RepID=A0A378U7B3_MYROD|nr:Uncharacterised protein [Myroides odoratus]